MNEWIHLCLEQEIDELTLFELSSDERKSIGFTPIGQLKKIQRYITNAARSCNDNGIATSSAIMSPRSWFILLHPQGLIFTHSIVTGHIFTINITPDQIPWDLTYR